MTYYSFDFPCSGTGSSGASTGGRISGFVMAALLLVSASANADDPLGAGESWLAGYRGKPVTNAPVVGPAVIPGTVQCEYSDLGGEGGHGVGQQAGGCENTPGEMGDFHEGAG